MNMKKIFKDVINFFSLTDDEISAKHEKPQDRQIELFGNVPHREEISR